MVEKPSKFQAAILGGVIIGLLSVAPFVTLCCCLWAMLGGALAARTLIKRSPVFPVTTGEGAAVGAFAGLIGSVIWLILSIILVVIGVGEKMNRSFLEWMRTTMDNPEFQRAMDQAIWEVQNQTTGERLAALLLPWLITAAILVGFGTLGGIIGVAMFEKRKGQPPVPPMPPPGTPGYGPGFAPPGPPHGGPQPPPGEPPYGGGDRPPY